MQMIEGQLTQTYEPPRRYTPENIIYWEPTSKTLRESGRYGVALLNKARKFLRNNSVDQIDFTTWVVRPIKDYNKTEHYIISTEKRFTCDCQGFRKKEKLFDEGNSNEIPICSHIIAVKQFCFIAEKNANL